jgi:hypothetical protein
MLKLTNTDTISLKHLDNFRCIPRHKSSEIEDTSWYRKQVKIEEQKHKQRWEDHLKNDDWKPKETKIMIEVKL